MEKKYNYSDALKAHREASTKYDYFLLALILGLLSLSIQTFRPTNQMVCICLMYFVWLLLFICLLLGLYRQENFNKALDIEADKIYLVEYKIETEDSPKINAAKNVMDRISNKNILYYSIQKKLLILAISVYIIFNIMNIELARQTIQQ